MEAYEFLVYFGIALPFAIAVALAVVAPVRYRGSLKLFVALLLLCHGSLGLWMALRDLISFTPIRPALLVAQEYVILTENLESIFIFVCSSIMSILIARRFVFPRWHAVAV